MYLNYHKWMHIRITNTYFTNGVCSNFDVLPFRDTARQIKNYQIIIKRANNQFLFYVGLQSETETFSFKNNFNGIEKSLFPTY